MPTCKCFGKTLQGFRCKNNAKYKNICLDTVFPVCWFHCDQRIVYEWCDTDRNNEEIPTKIFNFLHIYGICLFNFKMNDSLSSLVSSKIHNLFNFTFKTKEEILDKFFELFFEESTNVIECPICYTQEKGVKMPTCDHLICKDCICKWTVKTTNCPMCREEFSTG